MKKSIVTSFSYFLSTYLFFTILVISIFPHSTDALPHPYFSKHPKEEKQLIQLLKMARMQALEYQPISLSSPLQDLQGKNHTLSEYKGKVLLIGKWATWCSACRSEMPQKRKLRQLIDQKNFKIIGVSNESTNAVQTFYQKIKNPYDLVLLDPSNTTNKLFPGRSIPVTLLIDGWGWSIAFVQGAAHWSTTPYLNLINFLIARSPSPDDLKEKAPAPIVHFESEIKAHKNRSFIITFALTWSGESDKYSHISINLPKQKNLQQLGMETSSIDVNQQGNHRRYLLKMKANQAGKYNLNPITITYWLKDYDHRFQKKLGSIHLNISSTNSITFPKQKNLLLPISILAISSILFLLFLILARKKKQQHKQTSQITQKEKEKEDYIKNIILDILKAIENNDDHNLLNSIYHLQIQYLKINDDELEKIYENVRYGGQSLSPETRQQMLQKFHLLLKESYPSLAPLLNM